MPRAALSKVPLTQLLAEIEKRKGRLSNLVAEREAITKEIAELEALGFSADIEQTPPPAKRLGRPVGSKNKHKGPRKPLGVYVKDVLATATKGLKVREIEAKVLAAGYPTKAKTIYNPVMKVLAKGFKKVAPGVYALKGAVKAAVAVTAKAPKAKAKPKAAAKRGQFSETSDQFVLGLVKGKGATTSQINKAWAESGRKGVASPTLSGLFKVKKVKRTPAKGEKGFFYTATPAPF